MIVKNEEKNLPACLACTADLVSEIVVVDTGSTDKTKEEAARFNAKIVDFPWIDNFAAARNVSLQHATADWIFWMDADDRLDEDNRRKLRALLAGLHDENAAYVMKCRCLPDEVTGTGSEVDHVRLFRRHPEIRWRYRIHEQILGAVERTGGSVRRSDVVVQHTGYVDHALRRRKLERDLRLLQLEDKDTPNDAFILYNIGWNYHSQEKHAEALPYLQRSLQRVDLRDHIVPKLFALVVRCQCQLGRWQEALNTCRAGRQHFPRDVELIFHEGVILREMKDPRGAETCFAYLLQPQPDAGFGSIDSGLRGYKARHNLALVYRDQGRNAEAENLFRQVLQDRPDSPQARLALAEIYLAQQRFQELDQVLAPLENDSKFAVDAAVLRGCGLRLRGEFAAARQLMTATIARDPNAINPRLLLSHVLLMEGRDWAAAEKALYDVLALDPQNADARHNLAVLRNMKR